MKEQSRAASARISACLTAGNFAVRPAGLGARPEHP